MQKLPGCRFSNVYGPAEVNQCTYYHIPNSFATEVSDQPVPIGKVWARSQGRVVDSEDADVTPGETGELLVQSPTMMQGYWGRKDQTQKSILIQTNDRGESMSFYRTGDLVRELPDGNLVFVGRKDRQVKVRGYRVDLDDVENAISSLETVEEAGVYCVERDHSREIRASVILQTDSELNAETIKAGIGKCLSWYAVPAEIEVVAELPRTGSGKIDRTELKLQAEGITAS